MKKSIICAVTLALSTISVPTVSSADDEYDAILYRHVTNIVGFCMDRWGLRNQMFDNCRVTQKDALTQWHIFYREQVPGSEQSIAALECMKRAYDSKARVDYVKAVTCLDQRLARIK